MVMALSTFHKSDRKNELSMAAADEFSSNETADIPVGKGGLTQTGKFTKSRFVVEIAR